MLPYSALQTKWRKEPRTIDALLPERKRKQSAGLFYVTDRHPTYSENRTTRGSAQGTFRHLSTLCGLFVYAYAACTKCGRFCSNSSLHSGEQPRADSSGLPGSP